MTTPAFFSAVREKLFRGSLSQAQVDGINAIIDGGREYGLNDKEIAYCLATAYHETARTMQPIREYGDSAYFLRMYDPSSSDPARARLATKEGAQAGDGPIYYGRGYVQLTWRTNYRRMGALLGVDLEGVPDLALDPQIASRIMFEGMTRGLFTGKKLADYLGGDREDWITARKIINGLDKAEEIAGYAKAFYSALRGSNKQAEQTNPAEQQPQQGKTMSPIAVPILKAVLPSIVEAIPKLGRIFGSGSDVSERNIKAAEIAVGVVKDAVGAANEQEAAEKVKSDPAARAVAAQAIADKWLDLTETGGGGISGARATDRAYVDGDGPWWSFMRSPSFWFMVLAMPLPYMIVGSLVGWWGKEWPSDVRAALATAVVSLIVGGAAGYYWGQTTSRNRTQTGP